MRRPAIALLVLALLLPPALGADAPEALKAHNQQIVSAASGSDGVFAVQDDGRVRHVQSGLVCPASYPNVEFYAVLVYPSKGAPGLDVGCDYRRADTQGGADAKLTIFATQMPAGATVDQAFTGYRAELMQTWPAAVSQGEAFHIDSTQSRPPFDIRSEEFVMPFNNRQYTTQLIVAVSHGWTIEIRSTFTGLPNEVKLEKDSGPDAAALGAGDRIMGIKAMFDAYGTVGQ